MEEGDAFISILRLRQAWARTEKWIYVLFSFAMFLLFIFSLWLTRSHLDFVILIPVSLFWMVFLFRRAVQAAKRFGRLQGLIDKIITYQGGVEIKWVLEGDDE